MLTVPRITPGPASIGAHRLRNVASVAPESLLSMNYPRYRPFYWYAICLRI